MQTETGIKFKDQYWFAAGQHILDDDYEFGSQQSVSASRSSKGSSKKQSSTEVIKSGDTLILVIAQMPSLH